MRYRYEYLKKGVVDLSANILEPAVLSLVLPEGTADIGYPHPQQIEC